MFGLNQKISTPRKLFGKKNSLVSAPRNQTQFACRNNNLAMFFPCIATFVVLLKELGVVNMLKSAAIMIVVVLLVGGILVLIL